MNRRELLKLGMVAPVAGLVPKVAEGGIAPDEDIWIPMRPGTGDRLEKFPVPPEPKWHPFHSREDLKLALAFTPTVHLDWYFIVAMGDTIKDKYRSLMGMVDSTIHCLHHYHRLREDQPKYAGHSMIMAPEAASVFITASEGYGFHDPVLYDGGKIRRDGWFGRTALYIDEAFDKSLILVRRNTTDDPEKDSGWNYGRIWLNDFII
jgi:hypothetical protein